jgi:hypothetical protein
MIYLFLILFLIPLCFSIYLKYSLKQIENIHKNEKSLLDELKSIVEDELFNTGIDLENIFIHDASGGVYFYRGKYAKSDINEIMDFSYSYKDIKLSNPLKSGHGMCLPNIKDYDNLHTWMHEIYHFKFDHLKDKRAMIELEYEADINAYNFIKEKGFALINSKYHREIFEINLIFILKKIKNNLLNYSENVEINEEIQSFLNTDFSYKKLNIL